MNYLIIAYKHDSDDYCRGCHMASYSSCFDFINTNDREKALRFLVDKVSYERDTGEAGYSFTIFIDGKTSDYNDLAGDTDEDLYLYADYDDEPGRKLMADAEATADREAKNAVEAAKAAEARKKAAEEAQKAADKVRKAREKEENDLKEFERLKAKYEGAKL